MHAVKIPLYNSYLTNFTILSRHDTTIATSGNGDQLGAEVSSHVKSRWPMKTLD